MVGYVNGRDWNESSGLFFCVFKFATRSESLNMLIEGRIGTRAGSEHYGQYVRKLYDMELAVPESISARTLADMDRAVSNFKKGDVSPTIDLSDF